MGEEPDRGFTPEGRSIARARSPIAFSEAARICQQYRDRGALTPLDTRRLVESVEAILVEQATMRRLIIQLAETWRPVRSALNELHRMAVIDVVGHRPKRRRR
jgi:hypothetical protein